MSIDQRSASILQIVRSLPQRTVTATLRNRTGRTTRTFTGALLADYARAAGLRPRPPSIGFGNYYYVVTAADGFTVSLAYFEVTARATDKQVILACEQDGEPLRVGLRLVVPGDDLGARSIVGVVDLQLRGVPSVEPQPVRPRSDVLTLGGLVAHPGRFSIDDLARFTTHDIQTPPMTGHGSTPIPPRHYTGVLLWDVLSDAAPIVDPNVNEDLLRRIVVARATDGYASVISTGEIDPRFMGGNVLIATAQEGRPLADADGQFRLIVPYDKAVGRGLKSLHAIEVHNP